MSHVTALKDTVQLKNNKMKYVKFIRRYKKRSNVQKESREENDHKITTSDQAKHKENEI